MITVSAGYKPDREAYVIGFGLSDGNLEELKKSRPIAIANDRLKLPPPGCDFVILAVKDRSTIEDELNSILSQLTCNKDSPVAVLHVDHSFYVSILSKPDGRTLYIIMLDDVSYRKLREKQFLVFRARPVEGEATAVEIIIFWGPTEEDMKQKFQERGLIFDPSRN